MQIPHKSHGFDIFTGKLLLGRITDSLVRVVNIPLLRQKYSSLNEGNGELRVVSIENLIVYVEIWTTMHNHGLTEMTKRKKGYKRYKSINIPTQKVA